MMRLAHPKRWRGQANVHRIAQEGEQQLPGCPGEYVFDRWHKVEVELAVDESGEFVYRIPAQTLQTGVKFKP